MLKILWLSPNFNHYKARFLNHLSNDEEVELTLLCGEGRVDLGDKELVKDWTFELIKLNVLKKDFGRSKLVKQQISAVFENFDWLMIPAEKKNLPLFMFVLKLRKKNPSVRLFSYNHAQLKSKNILSGFLDVQLTKIFNNNLDRIVYYTESAKQEAIDQNLVPSHKAFFANNTIDNIEIEKHYSYHLPPKDHVSIVFIGRLIPSKRVADLIKYFYKIKQENKNIKLEIIGDGPERDYVLDAVTNNRDIVWHKTLIDEAKIAPIMSKASLVFVPGLSGLSINHAFAYGRPYATLKAKKHGPEISYLIHGKNGFVLDADINENINIISQLLKDKSQLESFCNEAHESGVKLSVQKWVSQIKNSLLHE